MKWNRTWALAALVTSRLAFPMPAIADSELSARVSLDLRDADARVVLQSFGDVLSAKVEIDPEIGGKLSILLDDVTVGTTLDAVCESVGCSWTFDDALLRFDANPAPPSAETADVPERDAFDVELVDADGVQLLRSLAGIADLDLDLDPGVEGRVTIHLRDVDVYEAVAAICEQLGCRSGFVVTDDERRMTIVQRESGG